MKDVAFFSGIGKALILKEHKCVRLIINQKCLQSKTQPHLWNIYFYISTAEFIDKLYW